MCEEDLTGLGGGYSVKEKAQTREGGGWQIGICDLYQL